MRGGQLSWPPAVRAALTPGGGPFALLPPDSGSKAYIRVQPLGRIFQPSCTRAVTPPLTQPAVASRPDPRSAPQAFLSKAVSRCAGRGTGEAARTGCLPAVNNRGLLTAPRPALPAELIDRLVDRCKCPRQTSRGVAPTGQPAALAPPPPGCRMKSALLLSVALLCCVSAASARLFSSPEEWKAQARRNLQGELQGDARAAPPLADS